MAEIRALEAADIPTVVGLIRSNLPDWPLDAETLTATVLDHPWAEEDLPSLVALDEAGEVIGFIGAQARRMSFDGKIIRGVCCSHLVVSPDHRRGAPGALLLGRLLAGPQDITWSDSATDAVVRAWRTFGGHVDHARAADFMLVLRAGKWVGNILATRARGGKVGRNVMPVGAFPVQAAGSRLTRLEPSSPGADAMGEDADAASIAEHLPVISRRLRAGVEWDEVQLGRTIGQIESLNGALTTRLVRRGGRPIGWYAYLARPGGVSRLLHLAAADRAADLVLGELVEHATAGGSAVLTGRAEPHLEWPLRKRLAALGFAWQPVIRARDPELAAAMSTSSSLLTRLDGELSPAH